MTPHTERVLEEIKEERFRQIREGFTVEEDMRHHPLVWVGIGARHLGLAVQDGGLVTRTIWRKQMVRLGAVAAAAVEAYDRNMEAMGVDPLTSQPEDRRATTQSGHISPAPKDPIDKMMEMAQRLANERLEDVYVVTKPFPKAEFTETTPYMVLASQASKWDRDNAAAVVKPEKEVKP